MLSEPDRPADDLDVPPFLGLSQPGRYRIQLAGHLRPDWASHFEGMALITGEDASGAAITTLSGVVIDQAALHGILARIRDLGLVLLRVEQVMPDPGAKGE